MLAVVVGQPGGLFTMLALVTAITLPGCNLVFPACCALMAHRRNNATNGDHDGTHATLDVNVASLQRADDQYRALPASDAAKPPTRDEEDPGAALRGGAHGAKFELSSFEQAAAYATLVMGIVMFFIAWYVGRSDAREAGSGAGAWSVCAVRDRRRHTDVTCERGVGRDVAVVIVAWLCAPSFLVVLHPPIMIDNPPCRWRVRLLSRLLRRYGAIGKITNAAVRGPEQIGCAGWGIWKSDDAPYHGWFGSDYP